jgi:hypothetical protein
MEERHHNEILILKQQKKGGGGGGGDAAKLVDTMDLIGLSLGIETYQVITFKFSRTLELKMCNSKPNVVFRKIPL